MLGRDCNGIYRGMTRVGELGAYAPNEFWIPLKGEEGKKLKISAPDWNKSWSIRWEFSLMLNL